MNAQGLVVQGRYGRSIMNGLHATWSVAAVGAGLLGAAAAGLGVPVGWHLAAVAVVLVVASGFAWVATVPDPRARARTPRRREDVLAVLRSRPALVALLAIAGLMVCSGAVEDSSASWGAVYLRDDLGAGAFVAGLPVRRLPGPHDGGPDRRRPRGRPVRAGAGRADRGAGGGAVPGARAASCAHPVAAIVGWGIAGLGVATLFPLAFSAAGAVPGVRPGDGIAVVGFLARLGFLATPPVIGAVADASTVGTGLVVVPVAALGAALLARSLRPRRADSAP